MRSILLTCVILVSSTASARAETDDVFVQAEAARLAGDCDRAVPLYRDFLARLPDDTRAPRARQALGECRASIADADRQQQVSAPAKSRWRDAITWTLLGGGTALALGGAAASNYYRGVVVDFNDARTYGTRRALGNRVDTAYRMQQVSIAATFVGLASLGLGTYRLITWCEASPKGATVALGGSF